MIRAIAKLCFLQTVVAIHIACLGADGSTPDKAGAYLGIFAYEVNSPVLRKQLQLPEKTVLLIVAVAAGSPAEKAELQVYDILLELDGTPLTDMNQLRKLIGAKQPGDKVTLSILSEGKQKTLTPVLGSRPVTRTRPAKMPEAHPPMPGSVRKPARTTNISRAVTLEIDLDELIRIAGDPNLSEQEKKQRVSTLVTRDLLKGLRLNDSINKQSANSELNDQINRALAPLPPATQEQLRQRILDKDGNVKDSVRILSTDKGPLIVVEEPSTSKPVDGKPAKE